MIILAMFLAVNIVRIYDIHDVVSSGDYQYGFYKNKCFDGYGCIDFKI
jgi:hypothetical protein